jgi:hypothetical protein
VPQPDAAQTPALPAQSPCRGESTSVAFAKRAQNGKGGKGAYAERQVENHAMRVKESVVIAIVRVRRERRDGLTPSRVRRESFSAFGNLRWDAGAVSRPEPDVNAAILRSRHNIISPAIEVKGGAVGEGTVEGHPTPFIAVDGGIAVVADGSSTGSFSGYEKKENEMKEIEGPRMCT